MIGRHRSPYNHDVPSLANLSNEVARTLSHSTAQYLIPILRAPNHVILQIEDRVPAMPVFRHSSIVEEWNGPLKADRLKGGGIKPGGRS